MADWEGNIKSMNGVRIPIEISARHVHICRTDFEKLFGKNRGLTFVKELSQPGQFLAKERVNIIGSKGYLENVAIVGPFRKQTQVEVSLSDTHKLGIMGIIRQSGNIEDTPGCTMTVGENAVSLARGVIVAKRHIHVNSRDAEEMKLENNQEVHVLVSSCDRSLIFGEVTVRVDENYNLAMHVDTDEANAFGGDETSFGMITNICV